MSKRLSDKQKEQITKLFTIGKTIDQLSAEFSCTKLTISRNLKKNIGEKKYQEIIEKWKSNIESLDNIKKNISFSNENHLNEKNYQSKYTNDKTINENKAEEIDPATPFVEIMPLNDQIEFANQKDLSSVPISEIKFPQIVYMIVDKKIELVTKYLKDYPDWQFLSKDELNRKTIEIYYDLKIAKRFCSKENKVIKVPNTEVFKIVAPLLLSRGISRIISSDKLIAL